MALLDALSRLKWLKYLFVDGTEGATEQDYTRHKHRRHIGLDHTPGVVTGLDVQATSPASLSVLVTAGRALDVNGDDPCLAVDTTLNLAGLVPASGTRLVYAVLLYAETEEQAYFVPDLGTYQSKYIKETPILRVQTTAPTGAEIELARTTLAAGQAAIATAQIDKSFRTVAGAANAMKKTGDAAAGELSAPSFRATGQLKAEAAQGIAPLVVASTTKVTNLNVDQLDGYHAATAATANTIPVRDPNGVIPGTAAGANNADTVDNLHASDFAPAAHVGTGGAAHSIATAIAAGFESTADKAKLDGIQVGAEVNQNAFGAVKSGATTVNATTKTDIIELAAGPNIVITVDAATKKFTIAVTGTMPNAQNADTLDYLHAADFALAGHNHDLLYRTIAELAAATGTTGAALIGAALAGVAGNTVQALLESLKTVLDGKAATGHLHDDRYFSETELGAVTAGASGADKIGAATIAGVAGNTIQAVLQALKTLIDGKLALSGGIVSGKVASTAAIPLNLANQATAPAGAVAGDIAIVSGQLQRHNGTAWLPLGGGGLDFEYGL